MLPALLITTLLTGGLLAGLALVGLRAGDRRHDLHVEHLRRDAGHVHVTLVNLGPTPVLAAASLRRAGLRLALEYGTYASRPRRARLDGAVLTAIPAGSTVELVLAAHRPGALELRVTVGQTGRLRTLHRRVGRAPAPLPRPEPTPTRARGARHSGRARSARSTAPASAR